jgi:hypothetical protein
MISAAHAQCPDGQCPLPSESAPTFGQRVDTAPFASVSCRVQNQTAGSIESGSGTVIASDNERALVLTCHHLFDGRVGRIACAFLDGAELPAKLIASDPAHDLALLELESPRPRHAAVAAAQSGRWLTTCGFGTSGQLRAIRGQLVGTAQTDGSQFASLRIAATVISGDSGGGVFDERGELCGVVWGVRDGVAYATPLPAIRDLLASQSRQNAKAGRPPATLSPLSPLGEFDRHAAWRAGVDVRLEQLADRIDEVRQAIPDRLTIPPPVDVAPQIERRVAERIDELRGEVTRELKSTVVSIVRDRLSALPATGPTLTTIVAGGASIASPLGLAIIAGAWLLRRRGLGGPRTGGFREPTEQAGPR